MHNRRNLFRDNKWLLIILPTILVVALFPGVPGNLRIYAGKTEELDFCMLHINLGLL